MPISPEDFYVCIKKNPHMPTGWFCTGDWEEGLIIGRIVQSGPTTRDTKFQPKNKIAIPFKLLENFIIPVGMRIPIKDWMKIDFRKDFDSTKEGKEIEVFQSENEDIIEEELLIRGMKANPTVKERGGVIVDFKKIKEKKDASTD